MARPEDLQIDGSRRPAARVRSATRSAVLIAALVGFGSCGDDAPAEPEAAEVFDDAGRALDPSTRVVKADGWELVAAHCTVCHSAQQFLRQRGTRQTWQSIIDWMQATQGLWQFPEGDEERIVAYLAANYGPSSASRRAPIPAALMPPNPYASEIRSQVDALRERGELPTGPRRGG